MPRLPQKMNSWGFSTQCFNDAYSADTLVRLDTSFKDKWTAKQEGARKNIDEIRNTKVKWTKVIK